MKKTFLILIGILFSLLSIGQSYYRAVSTELYEYNSEKEEWFLKTKFSDTKIIVVIEEQFITIQAKSPTMYKVFSETKEDINTEKLLGYRYDARDLKLDLGVKIDVIRFKESNLAMVSVVNRINGYNMRFFVEPMQTNE